MGENSSVEKFSNRPQAPACDRGGNQDGTRAFQPPSARDAEQEKRGHGCQRVVPQEGGYRLRRRHTGKVNRAPRASMKIQWRVRVLFLPVAEPEGYTARE